MGREARANASTIEPELVPFVLSLPVSKVDKAQRLVTGIATSEVLDKQGDVVDFATASKFFTDPELWPGNIREMHQPKAVGKAIASECDAANKTISITVRVSKGAPETWEKVVDGTLSMFSIGGSGKRVVEKQGDATVKRLFLEQLAEVSLVDNGANPMAKFEIVKSVDGKLADAQPAEPVPSAAEVIAQTDELLQKAEQALEAARLEVIQRQEEAAILKGKTDDSEKHKTSSGQEGKWYAGTDGKSFPISTAKDVANAARALGRTTQDKAKVKANIIRIANAHGLDSGLPDAWKKGSEKVVIADVTKGEMEVYDIDAALQAISFVEHLLAREAFEAAQDAVSANNDGVEAAEVVMLKTAIDALLEFLRSEYEDQFASDEGPESEAGPGLDAVALFTSSLAVIQKAGARHSKSDVDMIQKVHDLSNSLGADCYTDTEKLVAAVIAAGYDVKKIETPVAVEPTAAVQKLAVDLATTQTALAESQATVAKQAETVAALETRLTKVEAQPLPGGPMRSAHAVDKALGGPGNGEALDQSPEGLLKALQHIATETQDQTIKSAAAAEIVKLQTRTGLNRIDLKL